MKTMFRFSLIFSLSVLWLTAWTVKASNADECRFNLSGSWEATEKSVNWGCPAPNKTESNSYVFIQDGCKLIVKDKNRAGSYEGWIKGDLVTWKGRFSEVMGFIEWDSVALKIRADGNYMEGNTTWTYHGDIACDGKTHISMTRTFAK